MCYSKILTISMTEHQPGNLTLMYVAKCVDVQLSNIQDPYHQ